MDDDDESLVAEDEQTDLPHVSQCEHDMIMLTRAIVAGADFSGGSMDLTMKPSPVRDSVGPTCRTLMEDALSRMWDSLWRRGGWRVRRSVDGAMGRLWDRTRPAQLGFSKETFEFIRWLARSSHAKSGSSAPQTQPAVDKKFKPQHGDQLVAYMALDLVRSTPALRAVASTQFVRSCPLVWLGFAPYMSDADTKVIPKFSSLMDGAGPLICEALGTELAARWQAVELGKRSMTSPDELIALGNAQDAVAERFMSACDAAKRRDLSLFLADAYAYQYARGLGPIPEKLDGGSTLSIRMRARVAAGSLLRAVVRWGAWDQEHRAVRHFDDREYRASQMMLARFERIGTAGVERAEGWLTELASFAVPVKVDDKPV